MPRRPARRAVVLREVRHAVCETEVELCRGSASALVLYCPACDRILSESDVDEAFDDAVARLLT